MKHSDEQRDALISEQGCQYLVFWNASAVTIMVRDGQGVYYSALLLPVTYSHIALYIFQSFLINSRIFSCFCWTIFDDQALNDVDDACITVCDLRLVGINQTHVGPPFVNKNPLQVAVVLPLPSRLLVYRRPF